MGRTEQSGGTGYRPQKDPLGQRHTWILGRQHPSDLLFPDESVSRKHAQIVATSQGFYLSDLHSANGTFVNGYPLYGETRIYEKDVIVALVQGMANKEIADHLCISVNTVITHRRNIARKLQIHSPAGLTIYAIVNGLVDISAVKL